MAIQTIQGGIFIPSPTYISWATVPSAATAGTIDAADEGMVVMLRVVKAGNISKILFHTRTVTTGATLAGRLETFDKTVLPAIPSGTLFHANASGTLVVADTDDNLPLLIPLAAPVAVVVGDELAVIVKNPTASFGNILLAGFADSNGFHFPYGLANTGVSPAVSWATANSMCIGLEYDDGSYSFIPSLYPFNAGVIAITTFSNSNTPDEIGLRFKLAVPHRICGVWLWADLDGDCNINLYDADGVTKLASTPLALDKDVRAVATSGIQFHPFVTKATLLANTFYRLAFEPSSATNLSIYDFAVNAAAVLDAFDGGQNFHYTSAKDPNEESDWTQVLTRRPFMGGVFDGFDDGVSAGGASGGQIIGA